MARDVTVSLLADILSKLDLVVFERLPDGVFVRIGPAQPPAWFNRVFLEAAETQPMTMTQAFPFLERFLSEAEGVWRGGSESRLRSDPFVVTDSAGVEIPLAASAVVVGERDFLVIESPSDFDETSRRLQRAREQALAHDDHVRRTGALLAPLDAAQKLTQQLAAAGLAPEQQRLASAIREQLATLVASIETLGPLPKGVSRRPLR